MGCSASVSSSPSNRPAQRMETSNGKILVYGMAQSFATQRVMTTLKEKGLDFELKIVNLGAGEHLTPAYLANQPFGYIPYLVDVDGFTIYESRAICRYLESKYKGDGTELIPKRSPRAEGIFEQGVSIEGSYFDQPVTDIISEKVFKKRRGGEPDMEKVANARRTLGENLDVYEKILSKQQFIGGEVFTLADLFHLPLGATLMKIGDNDLIDSRPHVKQWWNKISSRSSWKAVSSMK